MIGKYFARPGDGLIHWRMQYNHFSGGGICDEDVSVGCDGHPAWLVEPPGKNGNPEPSRHLRLKVCRWGDYDGPVCGTK
jgi:hypothetical protein